MLNVVDENRNPRSRLSRERESACGPQALHRAANDGRSKQPPLPALPALPLQA
jgi:hypothetical protein